MPIFELIVPIVDILPQEGNNGACDKAVPTIDFWCLLIIQLLNYIKHDYVVIM